MSEKLEGVIYTLHDLDGNIRYIGYTKNTVNYAVSRIKAAAKASGPNARGLNAWVREIGLDNFEAKVVEQITVEKANVRLDFWHWKYTVEGADLISESPSAKASRKAAKALKKGRPHEYTQEQREAISRANKGRTFSPEHRRKISEKLKGHKHNLGRVLTDEEKNKISYGHHRGHTAKGLTKPTCRWCNGEVFTEK